MYSLHFYGQMIADARRMEAYVAALRKAVRSDSVVMDLGCGPGVLALIACKLGARHRRTKRNDASLLVLCRLDPLARHARPDAMHRDPALVLTVARGAHDSLDPHVVGRQVGELVLELVEVERAVDGDPNAVDSMSSGAVEMTTVVAVDVLGNLANQLAIRLPD